MKRLYALGIAILTLVALAGCNDTKEFAESLERTIVLTATHEGVSPDTKTLRMDDGSTWWNPKEEISVFYGSGSNGGSKFTSKNTTIAEITEFEGSISMSGNKEFWAVYPYSADNSCDGSSIITVIPSQQTGVEGNFSNDAFPAMGKSSSLSMPFYNICGGIKFFVSRTDIKSVMFKGNNGETLAGKVKVAFGADGKPEVAEIIDGKTEVKLTAPDGGTFKAGKYYYITLLPTNLDGGFTMLFNAADSYGALTSAKTQVVKRSCFGVLKNADSKVQAWEDFDEPSISVPGWLELPAFTCSSSQTILKHDMNGGLYQSENESGTRNWTALWDSEEHLSQWVAYPLNRSLRGTGSRSNVWGLDPLLPADAQPNLIMGSYGGGWTRGHQIPSADRLTYAANVSTFYGTNMTPQEFNFNGGIWASLEDKVRSYAYLADTLYVVTGCKWDESTTLTGTNSGFAVKVPTHYFKALLFKGTSTYTHSGYMAAGFFLPHDPSIAEGRCTDYIMSVSELEKKTGIDFFPLLKDVVGAAQAAVIEDETPSKWWY